MLAHFEEADVNLGDVHLHGQDIVYNADTAHYASFGFKYLRFLPRWVTRFGCARYVEVVHPTKTGALTCLQLSVVRPDYFDHEMQVRWDWSA
ncbi:hypothetical protein [Streptosporangium sp. G12]